MKCIFNLWFSWQCVEKCVVHSLSYNCSVSILIALFRLKYFLLVWTRSWLIIHPINLINFKLFVVLGYSWLYFKDTSFININYWLLYIFKLEKVEFFFGVWTKFCVLRVCCKFKLLTELFFVNSKRTLQCELLIFTFFTP